MKLGCLSNTPHKSCSIENLAQETLEHFKSDCNGYIKRLNRADCNTVTHQVAMAVPELDAKSVRTIEFSDALNNNDELSTQFGYVVFHVEYHEDSATLIFELFEPRNISRSAMADEVIVFADISDAFMKIFEAACEIVVSGFSSLRTLTVCSTCYGKSYARQKKVVDA